MKGVTSLANIEWDDEERHAIIRLSKKIPKYDLPKIIGHEMVHLRQYITGRLEEIAGPLSKWDGEYHIKIEDDADDYFLSPWEMEARALEAWLEYRWDKR